MSNLDSIHPLLLRVLQDPCLESLKSKLSQRLSLRGCESRTLASTLKKTEDVLELERDRFLKVHITDQGFEQVLTEASLNPDVLSGVEERSLNQFKESFLTASLEDYAHLLGTDQPVQVFGLGPEDFQVPKLGSEVREVVVEKMEELFFEKCSRLLHILDGNLPDDDFELISHRYKDLTRLHEVVRHEKEASMAWQRKEESQLELERVQDGLDDLVKLFDLMQVLAKKHRMNIRSNELQALAKSLTAKCHTLTSKLRCTELEVVNATYSPEAIKALKTIRTHLIKQIELKKTQIEKTKAHLKQYEDAGPELEQVVKDLIQVQKEIEGKKWALQELKEIV